MEKSYMYKANTTPRLRYILLNCVELEDEMEKDELFNKLIPSTNEEYLDYLYSFNIEHDDVPYVYVNIYGIREETDEECIEYNSMIENRKISEEKREKELYLKLKEKYEGKH